MRYGAGELAFDVPNELHATAHAARDVASDDTRALARGLAELDASPIRAETFEKISGLMLPDGTRPTPSTEVLTALLERLSGSRALRVFVCTGTHDPALGETLMLVERLREFLRAGPPHEVHVHDARRGPFAECGRTARGTPVEVAVATVECAAFLAYSEVKHHYFAGYSNPGKCYVPGVASLESVRANHALALEEGSTFGFHPWHPLPERRANPLAEDLVEGFELALAGRPSFALTVVPGSARGGRPGGLPGGVPGAGVLAAFGGETQEAAGRAMLAADDAASLTVTPTRYLVVSPGGAPYDESLYTAQRALELTRRAVAEGGEILFLARCAGGIGSEAARRDFFEPLTRPLDTIRAPTRAEYRLYGHKPVVFARLLRRLRRLHLCSDLPPEQVRAIHMEPAPDPEAVLARWAREAGPRDRVRFIDDAARIAVLG